MVKYCQREKWLWRGRKSILKGCSYQEYDGPGLYMPSGETTLEVDLEIMTQMGRSVRKLKMRKARAYEVQCQKCRW